MPGRIVAVFTPDDARVVAESAVGLEVPAVLATVVDLAAWQETHA